MSSYRWVFKDNKRQRKKNQKRKNSNKPNHFQLSLPTQMPVKKKNYQTEKYNKRQKNRRIPNHKTKTEESLKKTTKKEMTQTLIRTEKTMGPKSKRKLKNKSRLLKFNRNRSQFLTFPKLNHKFLK
jgi:hypothetical protein